jgi:RNA-binding protein
LSELRQANKDNAEAEEGETETMSELTAGKKRFVKRKLCDERPTVKIGKNGVSEEVLQEIKKQLGKNKMVKVKILKTALSGDETKQMASKIAEQTEASLVEVRGHTFMLYKPHKK